MLSAEELLGGAALTYAFEIPAALTPPGPAGAGATSVAAAAGSRSVRMRPLTVHDLQLISRAAKEGDALTATLMVQRSLLEPELKVQQVASLPVGLMQFLLDRVNEISGITTAADAVTDALGAPITKAAFVLSRAFGWTPQEVHELTLGQVLLHLEMLKESSP